MQDISGQSLLAADLEVRVFLFCAPCPPALKVLLECTVSDLSEAVFFFDVVDAYHDLALFVEVTILYYFVHSSITAVSNKLQVAFFVIPAFTAFQYQ